MNARSNLYKELNHNELLRIMASVFPNDEVLEHHLLSGGLFNTTYRVITMAHDVVLRMGPVHRELLLPYEHTLMDAEALTDKLFAESSIPASTVLHLDTSKTIVDRDFMVVERIDSVPLSDPAIPPEKAKQLHLECGKLSRRIHSVTGTKFGRLSNLVTGKGYDSWYNAIIAEFYDIFAKAHAYQVFDACIQEKTLAFVENRKELLEMVTVPRLAHADLWAGNVLVRRNADNYEICAIIDGDRAMFGDPEFDLATPWMITPEFLTGYGSSKSLLDPEDTQEKRKIYALLLALHDAYVWKVEYKRPDIAEENLQKAKKILNI